MKMPALSQLRQLNPQHLIAQPIFKDAISVAALGLAAVLNIANLLVLLVKVRRVDYPVPVHFSSLVGFDQVGSWTSSYRIAVFALAVTVVNGWLAGKSYRRNRLASFFLLLGAVVVALLCLIISLAFAAVQ